MVLKFCWGLLFALTLIQFIVNMTEISWFQLSKAVFTAQNFRCSQCKSFENYVTDINSYQIVINTD